MNDPVWSNVLDVHLLASFLADYYKSLERLNDEIQQLPLSIWLEKSSAGKRAWRAVLGKMHDFNDEFDPEKRASEQAERLLKHASVPRTMENRGELWGWRPKSDVELMAELAHVNSPETIAWRLERGLKRHTSYNWLALEHGIAKAFDGYFYTDAYKKYVQKLDAKKAIAAKLLAAMDTLEKDDFWAACGLATPGKRYEQPRRRINAFLEGSAGLKSPIGRIDGTVRERALAFELWKLFRHHFQANKTNGIFNFLLFDGIENPPTSEKPVEGWVKAWKSGSSVAYPG